LELVRGTDSGTLPLRLRGVARRLCDGGARPQCGPRSDRPVAGWSQLIPDRVPLRPALPTAGPNTRRDPAASIDSVMPERWSSRAGCPILRLKVAYPQERAPRAG